MPAKRGSTSRGPRSRGRPDLELVAGTTAHYEDPAYYQKTYADRTEDVRFYVRAAKRFGGPVLEYGCGNGRITLAMAQEGVEVVGIDISPAMLADLRARLADEADTVRDRVTIKRGDMRAFRARRRFPLVICPFNAFLHLYTRQDVERFLDRVREHLAPGGRLIFDVTMPDASELARPPARLFRTPPFVYPEMGRVRYGERFDYDPLRQILFVNMEFEPASGADPFVTPLAHRQFFPQELEALLHYNGFVIDKLVGDFFGAPEKETQTLVYEVRAAARRRSAR
ncbi:MAG: class I SAM-dependent methyltransferase [Myxococcales bacterium]|nr:class I SAM-dependent methyltransferase [Myxococcales bacterium]